ncbi:MAG: NAD(P)/FAD-dependent oxidoreductase [Chloroherpetonaceae bacterium]|nr:NAD(P)/FAD-dependent oxidoreductase [Chthonomonadaceae bacterium]MDW8206365.1 NAD(P)/FAD-dependent oxidoreductase [Chloroherpetonaceae bacterium]
MQIFDLVVIGGGSAGLKAARTAARSGYRVALVEEQQLGGECFWAGCVPTKAMLRAAEVWHLARKASDFGLEVSVRHARFAAAMAYRYRATRKVGGDGPEDAGLSAIGVACFHTTARFEGPHDIRVGDRVIRGEKIILATGTVPVVPPIPGLQEAGFITNREAVHLKALPGRLLVLGAGPIGLEFAQAFRRFGAEVTVVEVASTVLPREDPEIAARVEQYLKDEGIRVLTGAQMEQVTRSGGARQVQVRTATGDVLIPCDEILVAVGRRAAIDRLNLPAAGLPADRRFVVTDPYLRTGVPHILAPGDINGGHLYTHVASYQGRIAAHNAFADSPEPVDLRVVPRATFLDPEVASVGLTEPEALAQNRKIAVYTFDFAHSDRAILHGDARGLVKLIADAADGQILGGHIVGPHASSLIAEVTLAMRHHLPVQAIADTMHTYPTFPEAIESAALSSPVYRG